SGRTGWKTRCISTTRTGRCWKSPVIHSRRWRARRWACSPRRCALAHTDRAQMRQGDSVLQLWRIRTAAAYIPRGAHVLDVGCSDGALFRVLGGRIASGVGIDTAPVPDDRGSFRFIQGYAPEALPKGDRYDVITMLAVLEHIPPDAQRDLA